MIGKKILIISVGYQYTLSGKIRSFGWFHIPLLDPGYGGVVMEQGGDEVRLILLIVKHKLVDWPISSMICIKSVIFFLTGTYI